ncbi:hypothetical protein Q8G49_28160, partial [Klebsiella pneumoniae]
MKTKERRTRGRSELKRHYCTITARGVVVLEEAGECSDGRSLEQQTHGHIDAESITHTRNQLNRGQRLKAHRKVIVIDA